MVPLGPDGLPGEQRTFRASTWRENEPRFSADGKWIAYSTTDTGDRHVYIERVDAPGPRFQVSVRNGREPFWRADGKELYYHGPDRWLMAVTLDLTKPTPVIGRRGSWCSCSSAAGTCATTSRRCPTAAAS